ncbi:MAG TPA: uroporphyrinogen-III synthase [Cellulomonas sp.]
MKPVAEGRRGLQGLRVLVPRGGPWGDRVADDVRRHGGEPVVAPLVAFAPPADPAPLLAAVDELGRGGFDWLVVTSATTADALAEAGARVPGGTRVAAVGPATRTACERAGLPVDLVPSADSSGSGLAAVWPAGSARVLLPQSDLADPGLARGLRALGADVRAVVAYRTVPVPVEPALRADVAAGRIGAVLVTSGSVARQLSAQFGPLPPGTLVACLGPLTAAAVADAGLAVSLVAPDRSAAALVAALAAHVGQMPTA